MGSHIAKIAYNDELSKKNIEHEIAILPKLNNSPSVEGIQANVVGITLCIENNCGIDICYISRRYPCDLYHIIYFQSTIQVDPTTVMYDIFSGIAHAHSLKITHCDLKPKNILISEDGRAKVCDWGSSIEWNDALLDPTNWNLLQRRFTRYLPDNNKYFVGITKAFREKTDYEKLESFVMQKQATRITLTYTHAREKACDVFAACATVANMLGLLPFTPLPKRGETNINYTIPPAVQKGLTSTLKIDDRVAKLIVHGLDPSYSRRPTTEQILNTRGSR